MNAQNINANVHVYILNVRVRVLNIEIQKVNHIKQNHLLLNPYIHKITILSITKSLRRFFSYSP